MESALDAPGRKPLPSDRITDLPLDGSAAGAGDESSDARTLFYHDEPRR